MKKIFMELLLKLQNHGNLTAATMYRDGKYASFEVESEDAIYSVSIAKTEKNEEKKNED
jgi:hypothetical protein